MKVRIPLVFLVFAAAFVLEAWGGPGLVRGGSPGDAGEPPYTYYYKGRPVSMRPSNRFLALEEAGEPFREFVATHRLRRHPLSDRAVLKKRNLGLYQIRSMKIRAGGFAALSPQMEAYAKDVGAVIQPVFEQGEMILIPSDRVIVGFEIPVTAGEAARLLNRYLSTLGVMDIVPHRRNTVLVSIRRPTNGRAFEVSRALSRIQEVAFAEPDLLVVRTEGDLLDGLRGEGPVPREEELVADEGVSVFASEEPPLALSALTRPVWTTIVALDCESSTFPPAGWILAAYVGHPDPNYMATWGRTDYRSHGGSYSLYCAASGMGDPGVAAPGPAPENMDGFLRTPVYDLTGYEEVYVELWFYAVNEIFPDPDGEYFYDVARVWIVDASTFYGAYQLLAVKAAGDMTADPTTDGGWRRFLYRVPPAYRVEDAYFEFCYNSNDSVAYEGAYLDDILILGTPDVDTEPLGTDPYGGRQYELQNVGQIADLGNGLNDMELPEAWGVVSVSPSVVLAVVDEGVDLAHPDLNLVTGYDWDGTGDGAARGSHGTACAGNAGAIGENSIGVAGTAPGVKIMPVYCGESLSQFASAIDTAVANGADILSNSWRSAPYTVIENAVTDALSAGKIVVFAAGNGPDREPWNYDVSFPCNLTGSMDLICVGASSPTDEHKGASSSDGAFWWGSSYVGPGPDVCAPGPWSYTTDRQGAEGYNDGSQIDPSVPSSADYTPTFGGTSSSAPKVAGIAALMLSANPGLTPGQVKTLLKITADDIGPPGNDDKTGAGRVNAHKAVLFSIEDCGNDPVKVATTYYGSVQSAYDGALEGDEMQLRAQEFAETLDFDQEKGVSLTGGYDCYFTYPLLSSGITGALTVRGGTVTVRNLVLQ